MRSALTILLCFSIVMLSKTRRFLLASICLCLASTAVLSAPSVLTVDSSFEAENLGHLLQVLEDPSAKLDFADISAQPEENWRGVGADEFRGGYSSSAFWLRFTITAAANVSPRSRFMLDNDVGFLGHIDYFLLDNQQLTHIETGLLRPFSHRPYLAENFVLPIELNPGQTRTIYIRIASDGPVILPTKLYQNDSYHQYHSTKSFLLGFFFSLCFILGLYNLFLFFALRDYSYLYYTLNTFVICWFQASIRGFTVKYFWHDSFPTLSYVEPTFTMLLSFLTSMLFSISFLKLKQEHPRFNLYFTAQVVLCFVLMMASLKPPLHRLFMVQLYVSPFMFISSLMAAIYSLKHGNRSARFFVLGWTIYLAAGFISSIYYQGFLPASFFIKESILIGSALEGILLSMALADRIQLIQKEHAQAQKDAVIALEHSHKLKDEFLITISHELRTPLNGIIGALELNKHETDADRQHENNELIEESTRRMADAVDDLLCLSELNSGLATTQRYSFNFNKRLQDTFASTETACARKGLQFNIKQNFPSTRCYIGDADKLNLIFNVLLKNAVQFTNQGEINLILEESPSDSADDPRVHLHISVEDTGIGIETEKLSLIFDLFQQSSNGYTRSHEGLGIGLNICKNLVDLMGGTIAVYSEPNKGACFSVFFVLDIDNAVSAETAISAEHPPLALLVEDNEVNQKVLEKYLTKCGCDIVIANTGLEALERVNECHPDIIFMDCQMPIMDGFEATRQLRTHYPHKTLPIIAVTANTMSNDRLRCIEAGMNDYLAKPIKLAQIQTALQQWLPDKTLLKKNATEQNPLENLDSNKKAS